MAHNDESAQDGPRTLWIDMTVAALILLIGALVAYDSYRLGSSWAADGPEAGYFPFYIGALLGICGAVVLAQGVLKLKGGSGSDATFVTYAQLKQVLVILVPSTLYVVGVQLIGIYVPSALFIGCFMRFAGHYGWLRSIVLGGAISVVSFLLFEIWFKIPLPKGPVESLIGF